ncbi:MAG: putative toxin-antitoxin system toxin component, PIN family [Spirochaetaceae bacterium]|jgi:putative PIN family toxin of toxin-antitoxin system|nr:putative toxin-antitoxin system toxin component, PIN family [Spirochaetaceae bacterium]
MKIVLDSNIFVSSFFWKGNPRRILDRITSGLDELYITDEILQEIAAVMSRKKFDTKTNDITDYIKIIESYSIKSFPKTKIKDGSRDIDDNKILECGFECNIDFIITGDDDLLVLKKYNNIKIVKPKEYLDVLGEQ